MKPKFKRITAGLTAVLLIVLVFLFANSVVGNPISKFLATKDIKQYLATTYPGNDYKIDDVSFNFKFHEYNGTIISPSSKDSTFTITWRDSNNIYDTYDFNVLQRENTIQRYEKEASEQISSLLNSIPGNDIKKVNVVIAKEYYETGASRSLVLDSPYDKSTNIPLELTISCNDSATLEKFTTLLEQIHTLTSSNGYHINYYSIDHYEEDDLTLTLSANNITPKEIEGGHLLSLLKNSINETLSNDNEGAYDDRSLYVFSKE
ncbi:MAG: hypothetical protein Q4G58_10635 [bacterium]|nr:hypothetical protein [bacterium]